MTVSFVRQTVRVVGPWLGRTTLIAALGFAIGGCGPVPAGGAAAPRAFTGEAIALPDLPVLAADGRRYGFRDEIAGDHLLVITFNYTTCESICPIGNVVMQTIDREARLARRSLRLLSITIDPTRDTPQRLRAAAEAANASDRWWWLTGAPADIDRLLARFGARTVDILTHDPLFLVGDARTGRFVRLIGLPLPDQVLRQLAALDS